MHITTARVHFNRPSRGTEKRGFESKKKFRRKNSSSFYLWWHVYIKTALESARPSIPIRLPFFIERWGTVCVCVCVCVCVFVCVCAVCAVNNGGATGADRRWHHGQEWWGCDQILNFRFSARLCEDSPWDGGRRVCSLVRIASGRCRLFHDSQRGMCANLFAKQTCFYTDFRLSIRIEKKSQAGNRRFVSTTSDGHVNGSLTFKVLMCGPRGGEGAGGKVFNLDFLFPPSLPHYLAQAPFW